MDNRNDRNKTQGKRMKKIMDIVKRTGEGKVKMLSSPLTKMKLNKVHVGRGGEGGLSIRPVDEKG
jgi:hypothetical protein